MNAPVDDRKSAALAAVHGRAEPGARLIGSLPLAREVLRSRQTLQAGAAAEEIPVDNPEHLSVFFLDGEIHRKRRAAIARFFTPKAVRTRHREVMERATQALMAELRASGRARLDELSFRLAVEVAAEIVGLTETDMRSLARDIDRALDAAIEAPRKGPMRIPQFLSVAFKTLVFNFRHVRPAIKARRAQPRDDVISHTLQEGYSDRAILIECMTYGTAGMVTTREFIVMCAWHLFGKPDLRERFLASDEDGQLAIVDEILRLEPVAQFLHRKATGDFGPSDCPVHEGELLAVDIRAANTDEDAVGPCPFALDPDRGAKHAGKGKASFLSFGDGPHTCPGWQVALHETRLFLDHLLRVPGIALEREPDMTWNAQLMSYELRGAIVACDKADIAAA